MAAAVSLLLSGTPLAGALAPDTVPSYYHAAGSRLESLVSADKAFTIPAEDICLTDDGRQSMHIDWRNCQQLRRGGGWIHLRMRDRMGELRMRDSDFTVGTADAFCAWLAQTHPEIRQRG